MKVTLKTIAQITGVSIGTVSRALHNKKRIDPQVAERIRTVAKNLNYEPNKLGKSLVLSKRKIKLGVILSKNDFFDSITIGIKKAEKEIEDFGVSISLKHSTSFDYKEQLSLIEDTINEKIQALVIAPVNHPQIAKKINAIYKTGIPIIFLTRICENTNFTSYVGCNYARAGEIAGGIVGLLTNGKGDIAFFSSSLLVPEHKKRLCSFTSTIENSYPSLSIQSVCELSNDENETYLLTKETLNNHVDIDTIIYANGAVKGGYRALKECSCKRPLRIIFYDLSQTVKEGLQDGIILASITQNPERQGYEAIMLLFDYFVNSKDISEKYYYITPSITIKESI